MKTSSAKQKGRRCSQEVAEIISAHFGLEPGDVMVTPSSVTGPDLWLSPKAQREFPFAVECKNQESLNVWSALRQAEGHSETLPGVLFFKRNRSELYVALRAKDFLQNLKTSKPSEGDALGSDTNGLHGVQEKGEG